MHKWMPGGGSESRYRGQVVQGIHMDCGLRPSDSNPVWATHQLCLRPVTVVCKGPGTAPVHSRCSLNASCSYHVSLLSCGDWAEQLLQLILSSTSGWRLFVLFVTYSLPSRALPEPCHLSLQIASKKNPSSRPLQQPGGHNSSPAWGVCPATLRLRSLVKLTSPTCFSGPSSSCPTLFCTPLLHPDVPPLNN